MSLNGVLNFYKPPGMTSAQAVAFVKRLTGAKTGHAGTLDPEAAGVLPLLLGKATRVCDELMGRPKQYLAEMIFGSATDTQDAQGKVLERCEMHPSLEQVRQAAARFIGRGMQLPPQYSALKIKGKTAYQLAREGKKAQLSPRPVDFYELDIIRLTARNGALLRVRCGKGTYIRTLCHDLGRALGGCAHMRFLLREECGGLSLRNAATPEDLLDWQEKGFKTEQRWFVGLAAILNNYKRMSVLSEHHRLAANGASLQRYMVQAGEAAQEDIKVCLFAGQELLGIYKVEGNLFRLVTMLYEPSTSFE
ncbi:MAG: tRNA pseudouridine(55) synthase TruB [Christensenellales bacterium]